MTENEDTESDWSCSEGTDLPAVVATVKWKGDTYTGSVVEPSSEKVPSDIVIIQPDTGGSIWCRDAGDDTLTPMSRNECRKLLIDVIGKAGKRDNPSSTDITSCRTAFGTGYPRQISAVAVPPPTLSGGSPPAPIIKPSLSIAGDTAVDTAVDTAGTRVVSFKAGKQMLKGRVVLFSPSPPTLAGVTAVIVGAGTERAYWLRTPSDGIPTALSVTECKRLLKTILSRPMHADGPDGDDNALCVRMCGVQCPAQIVDAKTRNEKAKLKRGSKGPTRGSVDVKSPADVTNCKRATDGDQSIITPKRSRCEIVVSDDTKASASPVVQAALSEPGPSVARMAVGGPDAATVTVSGSAEIMLPLISLLARTSRV